MKFPGIKVVAKTLREINSADYGADCDEIDVRLQVTDTWWEIHSGDAQYDTDHRGHWGASSVPGKGRRFNAKAVARDLIADARDGYSQSLPAPLPARPSNLLRRCVFRPYRSAGSKASPSTPTFTLDMRATNRTDERGQTVIAYRLWIAEGNGRRVLFEGSDFAGSPMHADNSDATVVALMSFLTLRPGDTDADYFAAYTDEQRAFCAAHAEALSLEVMYRFGGDEG